MSEFVPTWPPGVWATKPTIREQWTALTEELRTDSSDDLEGLRELKRRMVAIARAPHYVDVRHCSPCCFGHLDEEK